MRSHLQTHTHTHAHTHIHANKAHKVNKHDGQTRTNFRYSRAVFTNAQQAGNRPATGVSDARQRSGIGRTAGRQSVMESVHLTQVSPSQLVN